VWVCYSVECVYLCVCVYACVCDWFAGRVCICVRVFDISRIVYTEEGWIKSNASIHAREGVRVRGRDGDPQREAKQKEEVQRIRQWEERGDFEKCQKKLGRKYTKCKDMNSGACLYIY
jgi:hypothetical protein